MLFHRKVPKAPIISLHYSGLCDRLNCLINAIYLAEKLERKHYVSWAYTRENSCYWEDLFEPLFPSYQTYNIAENNIQQEFNNCITVCPWYTTTPHGIAHWSIDDYKNITLDKTIIVWHPTILDMVPFFDSQRIAKSFIVLPEIQNKIRYLIQELRLDKNVIGLHSRETDKVRDITDPDRVDRLISKIISENHFQRIFVCSDSKETEERLYIKFPANVFVRTNKAYPVCELPCEPSTSIIRSKESVIEGLVDLHLLAATNYMIIGHPHSNFNKFVPNLQREI